MEAQIAGYKAIHLSRAQLLSSGFTQLVSKCENLVSERLQPLQVLRSICASCHLADRVYLESFSEFVEVDNVLTPQPNNNSAAIRSLLEQTLGYELSERFTDRRTATT